MTPEQPDVRGANPTQSKIYIHITFHPTVNTALLQIQLITNREQYFLSIVGHLWFRMPKYSFQFTVGWIQGCKTHRDKWLAVFIEKNSTYKWTHTVKSPCCSRVNCACHFITCLSDWLCIRLITYEEHNCVLQCSS